MAKRYAVRVCGFDTTEDLRGKRLTYEALKNLVLEKGRFSVWEASSTPQRAALFTRLRKDPDIETFDLGFPWTGVKPRLNR